MDKSTAVRWRQFQQTSPSDSELRKWAREFPNCLWAVVTGQASGVIVFDFDVKDGGMETLKRFGLRPSILTPSGGAHVYVGAPDYEVRGFARLDPENLPGMDLRADGQLATVYGTNVLVGGSYEVARKPCVYRVDQLPIELQRLITERRKAAQRGPVDLPEGFSEFTESKTLIDEALELVESGGSRNSAGFHLACQLRDERFTFEDAEPVMDAFATAVAEVGHPYTQQEAYNSLVSAYSSAPREPRGIAKYKRGDGFATTDYGNAERLVAQHGEDLRYAGFANRWLIWNEQRWVWDETGEVERRAKATVRNILRSAADVENPDARQKLAAWAKASESANRLKSMVSLAQTEPGVYVTVEDLDSENSLLNVANGTLDLRTGALHPHSRNDLITKLAPIDFDSAIDCPRWTSFLAEVVPDESVRVFLQRAIGYSLTGSTAEHVAFLLYGGGANGKTTFMETVRAVAGDYAQAAPADLLMAKKGSGIPNDLARLPGARLVSMSETEDGAQIAEARFKELTGGDRVTARFMYREFFEFTPTCKFWLATNHRPDIKSNSEAVWRRIRLVPFTVHIPENKRDARLRQKLWLERKGILAWAIRGALDWQRSGLQEPEPVRSATAEYRDDMDLLGDFLDECCEVDPLYGIATKELYLAYEMWADEQGIKFKWTQKRIGTMLTERGFKAAKLTGGRRGWYGLRKRQALHVVRAES